MSVPPITGKTGVSGSVAYWKQQATAPQDIALDRLAVTLETLRLGHNESRADHAELKALKAQVAALTGNLPWPFSEGP